MVLINSDCESGKWSSALERNDICVLPSFAVEVVGGWVLLRCRILVGSSGRSVALLLCRVLLSCAFGLWRGFCETAVLFFLQEA